MVRKKLFLLFILLLFLVIPSTLAITVKASIKVEPFHSAFVQVANPTTQTVISQHFSQSTDVTGIAEFEFKTTLQEVSFFVKSVHPLTNAKTEEWFEEIPISTEMLVDTTEGEYDEALSENPQNETDNETLPSENLTDNATEEIAEEVIEETEEIAEEVIEEEPEEIEELTQESPETGSGITGLFISDEGKVTKTTFYIIGIVAFLVIVLLVLVMKSRGTLKTPTLIKKSSAEDRLADAQKKIKEAQAEIKQIKKDKSLVEGLKKNDEKKKAQEEFEKAKEKLEKLGVD